MISTGRSATHRHAGGVRTVIDDEIVVAGSMVGSVSVEVAELPSKYSMKRDLSATGDVDVWADGRSPLLLVSDRWRPLHPRVLAPLAWTASGVLVLVVPWRLVVAFTVESRPYMSSGTAQPVWGFAFAPLFAIPALTTAVTWSYAKRPGPGTGTDTSPTSSRNGRRRRSYR